MLISNIYLNLLCISSQGELDYMLLLSRYVDFLGWAFSLAVFNTNKDMESEEPINCEAQFMASSYQ
ncbi:hypothetical protein C7B70_18355 [Chlorogloea sp. CCALA 695]|nr:hypothetical protein C7B70_18355 [Chlorogloea sp. CCALA 695]